MTPQEIRDIVEWYEGGNEPRWRHDVDHVNQDILRPCQPPGKARLDKIGITIAKLALALRQAKKRTLNAA